MCCNGGDDCILVRESFDEGGKGVVGLDAVDCWLARVRWGRGAGDDGDLEASFLQGWNEVSAKVAACLKGLLDSQVECIKSSRAYPEHHHLLKHLGTGHRINKRRSFLMSFS